MSKAFERELVQALKAKDAIRVLMPEYVEWEVGDDDITLDGHFTVKELLAIIDHVREVNERESKAPSGY